MMSGAAEFSRRVSTATGCSIHVAADRSDDGIVFRMRPDGLPRLHGFIIVMTVSLHTVTADFEPETFATDLIETLGKASAQERRAFGALARALTNQGVRLAMAVGAEPVDPTQPDSWPQTWSSFTLSASRSGVDVDKTAPHLAASELAVPVMGLLLSILPVQSSEAVGAAEGGVKYTVSRDYERSPANRAACIALKGYRCCACGVLLEESHGEIAAGLVHVHHVVPVSKLGDNYELNIERDLVPLCPNCHAVVHRQDPPVSIERLRASLQQAKKRPGQH